MLMGWLMPALVFGAGLYIKGKAASGKYRWLTMTEKEAKGLPVVAAVAKAESGDALPPAPQGFRWRPITLMYAASPFSAPSEVEIYVLEQWLNEAPRPQGGTGPMNDYDSDPSLGELGRHRGGGGRHHHHHRGGRGFGPGPGWGYGPGWYDPFFVVYQEPVILTERETFDLAKEQKKAKDEEEKEKKRMAGMGDAGADALKRAIGETAAQLRARGLSMARIDPWDALAGDFVVLRQGCRLGQIMPGPIGGLIEVEVIHPTRGREGWHPSKAACAFGVRRA